MNTSLQVSKFTTQFSIRLCSLSEIITDNMLVFIKTLFFFSEVMFDSASLGMKLSPGPVLCRGTHKENKHTENNVLGAVLGFVSMRKRIWQESDIGLCGSSRVRRN